MRLQDTLPLFNGSNAALEAVAPSPPGRTRRSLLLALASGALLALSQPAAATQVLPVDFAVHETLPSTTHGTLVGERPPEGCERAIVTTIRAGRSQRGDVVTFSGSKKLDCGSGDTLTIAFKVSVSGCGASNAGTWQVTRGTGRFASAQGQGKLVGTYTLGTGLGTSCNADGVNDRYTGQLRY